MLRVAKVLGIRVDDEKKDDGVRSAAKGRGLMQTVGIICVVLAILIITSTIFTYFRSVLPLVVDRGSGATWWVVITICTWLSFNLMFNYVMVLTTPAGRADASLMTEADLRQADIDRYEQEKRGGLWCRQCSAPRPVRAHHCPLCGYCVLKMDHHCPWINQCVGHYNHRYFVLFLAYLLLSVTFASVTISLHLVGVLKVPSVVHPFRSAPPAVLLCYIVCMSLTIVMAGFLAWTGYLILRNQTTIEYMAGLMIDPYATRRKNLEATFGQFRYLAAILLPCTQPLRSNGHTYANNDPVLTLGGSSV